MSPLLTFYLGSGLIFAGVTAYAALEGRGYKRLDLVDCVVFAAIVPLWPVWVLWVMLGSDEW